MALLWPTLTTEQSRTGEALRRALGHAVTLGEASAGVLALADDGDEARERDADGARSTAIHTWGMPPSDGRQVVARLAADPTPEPLDGRPRATVLAEIWGGEIATLALGDAAGTVGDVHLLGPSGFSTRRALAEPARRQALVGVLVSAVRMHQEIVRLRQENRQLGSILHFSGDGIVTVDAQLRITGFNPAMEAMTAWRQHEVIGRFYGDVLQPHTPQGVPLGYDRDPLVQAIEGGMTVLSRELVLLARDGQRVIVSVTAAAVRSPQGQPISGVLNVRDVTRTREAEELRTTFTSVISHELQTPIAIIKGYASTLAREDAHWDAETLRERLHAIEEEADRLNHLVGNILYASRIQAGGLKMERTEVDLAQLARSVVRRFNARGRDWEIAGALSARMSAGGGRSRAHRGGSDELARQCREVLAAARQHHRKG